MARSLVRSLALVAAIGVLLGACGVSSLGASAPTTTVAVSPSSAPVSSSTPKTLNLSGTWDGTWQNTTPDTATGTFTIIWTQTGSNLSGAISIKASTCISQASITGSISGDKISFGVVNGQAAITYDGTVSGNDTIKGAYHAPSTCGNAVGTWTATRK
ncbi:MAG TPA: hypothetical protein VH349_07410 [Ktedonobacterales bacterium]|jgi:hypothetical protein